jgi:methionyl-tRNA synthetase
MSAAMRSFLVTATPPTTNGDLHVGHLSGPYLGADVFTRAQRMLGNIAWYASGGDDHQTYVVTTAERLGVDPVELAAQCNRDIRETLCSAEIAIDAFTTPDAAYRERVQSFFASLYRAGKLARRTWPFPYCEQTGRFLLEAFASGFCPECFAPTCGAICETCGHPNDVHTLLLARSSGAQPGSATERRDVEILVLPLDRYRERFLDFYARQRSAMRPHVMRFIEEMLARPLPDFPVSYPADWGIPVPVDGFDGQVLNVWAEMLPGLMYMTDTAAGADTWSRDSGFELVQFLGYDNTFYFSLAHLGLNFADGTLIEPTAIVTNELYQLDGAKFSTSKRHLIWARDLVAKYGSDSVRFYLALANPEHQQANFTEAEFRDAVRKRLADPLTAIGTALTRHAGREVPCLDDEVPLLARYRARMIRGYAVESFSLRDTAMTTANLLGLLASQADEDPRLAVQGLRVIAELAAPLLPALAARICSRYADALRGTVPRLTGLAPSLP